VVEEAWENSESESLICFLIFPEGDLAGSLVDFRFALSLVHLTLAAIAFTFP